MRNWLLHTHAFICSRPPTEIQDRSKKNFQAKQCMVPWRLGFAVATILSFTGCTIYCSCFYSIQWSTTSHASPVRHCSWRFLHSRIVQNLCLSTCDLYVRFKHQELNMHARMIGSLNSEAWTSKIIYTTTSQQRIYADTRPGKNCSGTKRRHKR